MKQKKLEKKFLNLINSMVNSNEDKKPNIEEVLTTMVEIYLMVGEEHKKTNTEEIHSLTVGEKLKIMNWLDITLPTNDWEIKNVLTYVNDKLDSSTQPEKEDSKTKLIKLRKAINYLLNESQENFNSVLLDVEIDEIKRPTTKTF